MNKKQKKTLQRIIIAAILTVTLALLFHFVALPWFVQLILWLVPYLVIGHDVLRKAFMGIKNGEVFDENFLMAIATVGAVACGEYSEGVAVMLFYQIGELFQSYAVGKSRSSITALMDIRPDYANIERDGKLVQVDPDEVQIGETIVVKPGERISLDGTILKGFSTLDTSALTGESMPREVEPGMEVISGCINQTGILNIQTTKEFGESTVAKILGHIGQAAAAALGLQDAVHIDVVADEGAGDHDRLVLQGQQRFQLLLGLVGAASGYQLDHITDRACAVEADFR